MLLWPFNKYPGTDYETFNWEWILKTVKDYTKKVDDFIAGITETWNAFRAWTTGEINQMHDDFANYVNVTEGALNAGAIADGAITEPKYATGSVSSRALADGAVTAEKMNSEVLYYKTPEMFGAVGDGVTDDTAALNACMAGGGVIKFENGKTYKVTPFINFGMAQADLAGVKIQSHSYIDMNGATITCDVNEASWYSLVNIDGVEDVQLINGKIIGEYEDRVSTNGEAGFGVYINDSHDVTIENIDSSWCHGDSFIIWKENTNVTLKNCIGHHSARQGLSIIGSQDLIIDGCEFHDISGKSPQSGVDIEGYPNDLPGNIILRNLIIYNTAGPCLKVMDDAYNVVIDSCELRKTGLPAGTINARDVSFKVMNTKFTFTDAIDSTIDIENCEVYRGTAEIARCNLKVEHSDFESDEEIWVRGASAVWKFQHSNIRYNGTANVFNTYGIVDGGLEIENCNIVAPNSARLFNGQTAAPGGRIYIMNSYVYVKGVIGTLAVNVCTIANSLIRMINQEASYGVMTLYNTDIRISDTYIRRDTTASYLFAHATGSTIKTSNVTLEQAVTNLTEGAADSMYNHNLCNGIAA